MSKSPDTQGHWLEQAKSKLLLTPLEDSRFHREGPRAFVEYRDLGMAEASDGRITAKHIRAIVPFEKETGWHWHDMTAHFVYVLKVGSNSGSTACPTRCGSLPAPASVNPPVSHTMLFSNRTTWS